MTTIVAARRRARFAALVLLVLLGTLGLGPAAQAHDMLVASDPADGAVLDAPPESITLTFNNPPLEVGSVITVVDADGTTLVEGEGTLDGADVVLALDAELPAGQLEVRWRVASSDGHPIDGVIPFEVTAPAEPTEPATTEPTEPAAAEPATTERASEAATTEPAETAEESGLSTVAKVAIAVAAVGAVAALILLIVKRRRTDRV
ncbi:copper resistance CopC family protein [Oceanitalea stevensii]|uniref:Copper resistance protein CopC n=1 Tax=Oceanitalea stevensii TaxID=2763072 RepID=A0ABR8Z524_9MICO|nr:copper resistance CopC family protein [Oceanitalea stevensii]MBD8063424.1 copper resistance protein CopC [Oceanitalea stevensii]